MNRTHRTWLPASYLAAWITATSLCAAAPVEWSRARLEQVALDFARGRTTDAILRSRNAAELRSQLASLQATSPETGELFQAVTFTLAYLGIDYPQNLAKLKWPVELMRKQDSRWKEFQAVTLWVPDLLYRLYRHNRDNALMVTLLSWRLDGHAAEQLGDIRIRLSLDEPLAVLMTLQSSPKARGEVVETLGRYASDYERQRAIAKLRSASRAQNRSRRAFADQLVRQIAAEHRHMRIEYEELRTGKPKQ